MRLRAISVFLYVIGRILLNLATASSMWFRSCGHLDTRSHAVGVFSYETISTNWCIETKGPHKGTQLLIGKLLVLKWTQRYCDVYIHPFYCLLMPISIRMTNISVGTKGLWAESRVQETGEYFPPLQFHI
ncbi:hypothetical protein TNCV_4398281 [Trichonephila clavipes]|nr:hypothetical protein TNCV_4398281 [Trichonephila clavipes]